MIRRGEKNHFPALQKKQSYSLTVSGTDALWLKTA